MKGGVMSNISRTDWSRIDAMTDEEIDTSDIPPLSDEFFFKAKLRMPSSLATVSIRVDAETLAWFQSKGEKAEQHMAAALRIYAEAQKNAGVRRTGQSKNVANAVAQVIEYQADKTQELDPKH